MYIDNNNSTPNNSAKAVSIIFMLKIAFLMWKWYTANFSPSCWDKICWMSKIIHLQPEFMIYGWMYIVINRVLSCSDGLDTFCNLKYIYPSIFTFNFLKNQKTKSIISSWFEYFLNDNYEIKVNLKLLSHRFTYAFCLLIIRLLLFLVFLVYTKQQIFQ